MTFNANETVYCRFTGQAFTVLHSDGVLVGLRFAGSDETSTRIVGELTHINPDQLHTFADGEFTITVRTTLQPNGEYTAVDDGTYDCDCDQDGFFSTSPVGYGLSTLGAIADLFEKLPRAESDREERDHQAAKFDRARDLRKHEVA